MISVSIMAHKKREHFVAELRERLDLPAESVVWDRHNDRCETGLRCLQAFDPDASYHLVLQDDALVCQDLLAGLEALVEVTGDHPVSLYVGRVRPHPQHVHERFNEARQAGRSLLRMHGPLWGVGIVYPTQHLPGLCEWFAQANHPNYDGRVSRWYMDVAGLDCLYTVPSLVEHRAVDENPSMIEGRTGNRQAHWFLGTEASALAVDWAMPPPAPVVVHPRRFRFRNPANGRTTTGVEGTRRYDWLAGDDRWEVVEEVKR